MRSLGELKALKGNALLPARNGGTLWEEYIASDQPKWLEQTVKAVREAENGSIIGGLTISGGVLCMEWTDDQWTRRHVRASLAQPTKPSLRVALPRSAASSQCGSGDNGSQPPRKRSARVANSPSLPKTKWVFRELSKVLVTLPLNVNAGDSFGLRIPGCETVVPVEFPESGVPGKQIKFPLDPPLRQKVLRSELQPGERSESCYLEGDDRDLYQEDGDEEMKTQVRRRPTSCVPLPAELVAMRAEMQRQPGLQCGDVSGGKEKRPIPVVNTVDEEQLDLNSFHYVSTREITPRVQTLMNQAPAVPCNCGGAGCGGVGNAVCGCVQRFGDVYDLVVKVTLKTLPLNQASLDPQIARHADHGVNNRFGAGRARLPGHARAVRARKLQVGAAAEDHVEADQAAWTTYPSMNQASKATGVDYTEVG